MKAFKFLCLFVLVGCGAQSSPESESTFLTPGLVGGSANMNITRIPLICKKTIASGSTDYTSLGLANDIVISYQVIYGPITSDASGNATSIDKVVSVSIASEGDNSTASKFFGDTALTSAIQLSQDVDTIGTTTVEDGVWSFTVVTVSDATTVSAVYSDSDRGSDVTVTFTTAESTLASGETANCAGTLSI